ncbi:hypothetical protein AKJ09_05725 [Labilithrix luteola]|uniref:Uncharacterized protein n=1 Tax=Labilithrix luteola TaxID=1391654 RepID=A0A0K1Q093_9BACT|nr:hypothetical protein [Labilithrix luteola]AKU99061.1 hypothetical protein AKJ09_05725 [Labilithrix luteola]
MRNVDAIVDTRYSKGPEESVVLMPALFAYSTSCTVGIRPLHSKSTLTVRVTVPDDMFLAKLIP